jgi:hypothetical protein
MKAVWAHTAARRDSNPRGYERGIGPNHLRKGRHEPSSCACDRGHRGYKHWDRDRIWAMAPQDGIRTHVGMSKGLDRII